MRLIAFLGILMTFSLLNGAPQKEQGWIEDQDDQTDTFAIPLDTSEDEEEAEEEALYNKQRKAKSSEYPSCE